MNRPSIQRRICALETITALTQTPEYPPLTAAEIDEIARRIHEGETLTRIEVDRLERQSPVVQGELLMVCHGGQVNMKRYLGIDLAEL